MVTRIGHIQHHLWVDIQGVNKASRLPILISKSSNSPAAASILINSITASTTDGHAAHSHKIKTAMHAYPADAASPLQPDTANINVPTPLTEDYNDTL